MRLGGITPEGKRKLATPITRCSTSANYHGELIAEALITYPWLLEAQFATDTYRTCDPSNGMLDLGPSVVFADHIEPVEAIFDRLIDDALEALARMQRLTDSPSMARSISIIAP